MVSEWESFSVQIGAILGVANCSQNQHKKHCELVAKMEKYPIDEKSQNEIGGSTIPQRPRASEEAVLSNALTVLHEL